MSNPEADDWEQQVNEGLARSDYETSEKLRRCSAEARHLWAALASCQTPRGVVPIAKLAERVGIDLDTARARAVELDALKLIAFVDVNAVSHRGLWANNTARILGGEQGSALWPRWDFGFDHREVLERQGEV